ncbi:MAG: hypothetical protein JSR72_03620 [Proteobacteria bacterium]|nr:hypothetical protein [Pseudomonadota bacterium]
MNDKLTEAMRRVEEEERNRQLLMRQATSGIDLAAFRSAVLQMDPVLKSISETAKRNHDLMRGILGPFEELHRSPAFASISQSLAEAALAAQALAEYKSRFQLPDFSQTARIIRDLNSSAFQAAQQFKTHTAELSKAIEAMRSPWLDTQNRLQSIGAFAELQSLGIALRELPAFNDRLAGQLRDSLGDWRLHIDWPDGIFTDPLARSAFYVGRGLSPGLTDFPSQAFHEGLEIAGLVESEPISQLDDDTSDDEPGLQRTNAAHDRLLRFETRIRRFIEALMAAQFGEHWIKHRVPGEIRKKWQEKRELARSRGEKEWPLIAYADFTDYVPIITRSDNWDAVFKPVFYRPESIIESFQRLYPIRICTMHARIITQDDELYLQVELKRILQAISEQS